MVLPVSNRLEELVYGDAYEAEVEATVGGLTELIGPLMIVAMGGAVFFIALGLGLFLAVLLTPPWPSARGCGRRRRPGRRR